MILTVLLLFVAYVIFFSLGCAPHSLLPACLHAHCFHVVVVGAAAAAAADVVVARYSLSLAMYSKSNHK